MQLNTKIRILINNIYKNKNNIKKNIKKVLTDIFYGGIVLLVLETRTKLLKQVSLKERRKLKKFLKKELTNKIKFVKLKKLKRAK